ncbi:hypothetical protein NVP1181O_50 [Vibrio phage 1.181.O._10N.286.46.C9]|nr:hypothetical protein NVP1181O_50 [Vibrio phage 1.181.O._10N.286.46.C9]
MPSPISMGSVGGCGSIVGSSIGVEGSSGITGISTTGGCGIGISGSGTNTGGSICGFVSGVSGAVSVTVLD